MISIYEVAFHKNIIKWGKYIVYIKYNYEDGLRIYQYRKDLSNLFDIEFIILTKILVSKYNAEIIGGKHYCSFFAFEEQNITGVKEYFESLIIMKQLDNNTEQ